MHMLKPQYTLYNNSKCWNASRLELVEYIIYASPGAVGTKELLAELESSYELRLAAGNLQTLLTKLVRAGRVQRFGRGVYLHVSKLATAICAAPAVGNVPEAKGMFE